MNAKKSGKGSLDEVRRRAGRILMQWKRGEQTVEELLEAELKRAPMEHREHARLRELLFGCMHTLGRHEFVLRRHAKRGAKMPHAAWASLVLALHELASMRTPDHAAVDQAVDLCRRLGAPHAARFVNGVLRSALRDGLDAGLPTAEEDPIAYAVHALSHPEWIVRRWSSALGPAEMLRLCEANNRRPSLLLRCKPGERQEIGERLRGLAIEWEPARTADGIRLLSRIPVPLLLEQLGGRIAVQDEAAQCVSPLLAASAPELVVDLCAAPGGKALHLAQLLPAARILAVDSSEARLQRLRENQRRLGITNIEVLVSDGRSVELPAGSVDAVLVDAPCTGTGVMARRHDLRWRRNPKDLDGLLALQSELLEAAGRLLRPGGVLVYATCSLEREENDLMVDAFLESHAEFEERAISAAEIGMDSAGDVSFFEGGRLKLWPQLHACDGAFAARLQKRTAPNEGGGG